VHLVSACPALPHPARPCVARCGVRPLAPPTTGAFQQHVAVRQRQGEALAQVAFLILADGLAVAVSQRDLDRHLGRLKQLSALVRWCVCGVGGGVGGGLRNVGAGMW
jgi:hypothetical protein